MEITEVRIKLTSGRSEKLRAFCSITIDNDFVIRDLKVIEGSKGAFVAMPSRKLMTRCQCGGKNHYRARFCNECGRKLEPDGSALQGRRKLHADVAHPINSGCREIIQKRVLELYHDELEKAKDPNYAPVDIDDFYDDEDFFESEEFGAPATAAAAREPEGPAAESEYSSEYSRSTSSREGQAEARDADDDEPGAEEAEWVEQRIGDEADGYGVTSGDDSAGVEAASSAREDPRADSSRPGGTASGEERSEGMSRRRGGGGGGGDSRRRGRRSRGRSRSGGGRGRFGRGDSDDRRRGDRTRRSDDRPTERVSEGAPERGAERASPPRSDVPTDDRFSDRVSEERPSRLRGRFDSYDDGPRKPKYADEALKKDDGDSEPEDNFGAGLFS